MGRACEARARGALVSGVTVRQVVREYLVAKGIDGLVDCSIGCGCVVADLMPCDGGGFDCEAARRVDRCGDPECEGCVEVGWHLEPLTAEPVPPAPTTWPGHTGEAG